MYKTHAPAIAQAMQSDPAIFRRGVMFAVCSIRQATINVPDQLGVLFDGDDGENPLFGHKWRAWEYIQDDTRNKKLWIDFCLLHSHGHGMSRTVRRQYATNAIMRLLEIPGLGIVKAAFVAQLFGFDVACLDARNIAREGRDPRAYRTDGRTPESLRPKVEAYVGETFGQSEKYWNAWCKDVAAAYGRTPEEISALHMAILPNNHVPF